MRARPCCILVMRLTLLCAGALAQDNKSANSTAGAAAKTQQPALDLTYVANEGFLIQADGKKVLVDALFDDGFGTYLAPSRELLTQMNSGSGPFADVDLLLVTHTHGDHFSPKLVVESLRNHARCRLVAHSQTVDLLRKEEVFAQIERQIHQVKLDPGAYEHASLNGIAFDALCLKHMADDSEKEQMRNLAFIFELGGVRFLHMGDSLIIQSETYLKNYPFEQSHVDLLFLNQYDRTHTTQKFIAEKIKPSRIVAMHLPPAEFEEESKNTRAAYPHAIVFKQSMERRSLPIEVGLHNLTGEYFGLTPPGDTPQVFARGIVSKGGFWTGGLSSLQTGTRLHGGRTGSRDRTAKNGSSSLGICDARTASGRPLIARLSIATA